MSRTDAHAPYWTQAVWYEPVHHIYCGKRTPCDLPEHPVRHAGARTRVHVPLCTWEPVWPRWREVRWRHISRVPRWYVQHVWDNPERVRARDGLRAMAKEYNALRELQDGDHPNHQHRHGATWYWD